MCNHPPNSVFVQEFFKEEDMEMTFLYICRNCGITIKKEPIRKTEKNISILRLREIKNEEGKNAL